MLCIAQHNRNLLPMRMIHEKEQVETLWMLCPTYYIYDWPAILTLIVLTAVDVRCAVANTNKIAKWMMCRIVSEGVTAAVRYVE